MGAHIWCTCVEGNSSRIAHPRASLIGTRLISAEGVVSDASCDTASPDTTNA